MSRRASHWQSMLPWGEDGPRWGYYEGPASGWEAETSGKWHGKDWWTSIWASRDRCGAFVSQATLESGEPTCRDGDASRSIFRKAAERLGKSAPARRQARATELRQRYTDYLRSAYEEAAAATHSTFWRRGSEGDRTGRDAEQAFFGGGRPPLSQASKELLKHWGGDEDTRSRDSWRRLPNRPQTFAEWRAANEDTRTQEDTEWWTPLHDAA